ncbi:MAG: hypothetical protein WAL27_04585 [Cellulosimicrobium cellulans]
MKPLDSIETTKTRLGSAGDTACWSVVPSPSMSGDGKDAAVRRRLPTGTSTWAVPDYATGAEATPQKLMNNILLKAMNNILLKAGKMQTTQLSTGTGTHAAGEGPR